jgi:hypothetical protein
MDRDFLCGDLAVTAVNIWAEIIYDINYLIFRKILYVTDFCMITKHSLSFAGKVLCYKQNWFNWKLFEEKYNNLRLLSYILRAIHPSP